MKDEHGYSDETSDTQGRMPGGKGEGPGGVCTCPECGATIPHETGEPCYKIKCPKCGAMMDR